MNYRIIEIMLQCFEELEEVRREHGYSDPKQQRQAEDDILESYAQKIAELFA